LAGGGFVGADAEGLLVALLVGAAEVLAGLLAQVIGAAGDGWGRWPGAQGAGGLFGAAGDQAGGGLVGAEVGQVVGGQLGGEVAFQVAGVLG
jgi:hypothetical protein